MLKLLLIISTALFFHKPLPPEPETLNLSQLQSRIMKPSNDTLYVVNFWATWCRPCLQELPYFEKAGTKFASRKVKVILVSLDFMSDKTKLNQFVSNRKLNSEVCHLNAGDPNVWLNQVDRKWEGSIPATVMYREGKKVFFKEGQLSQRELDSTIQNRIK